MFHIELSSRSFTNWRAVNESFPKVPKVTEQLKQREEITPNYPLKLIIQKKKKNSSRSEIRKHAVPLLFPVSSCVSDTVLHSFRSSDMTTFPHFFPDTLDPLNMQEEFVTNND